MSRLTELMALKRSELLYVMHTPKVVNSTCTRQGSEMMYLHKPGVECKHMSLTIAMLKPKGPDYAVITRERQK